MIEKKYWLILMIYFGSIICILAQASEKDKEDIRQRIQLTDQLLAETQGNKDKSLIELGLLNRKLRLSEQLIVFYQQEIEQAYREIKELDDLIASMEADRLRIVEHYARTAQLAYQNFTEDNFWLSLFSAGNITEAYYRSIYFQQFSRFRKKQIDLIRQTEAFLTQKKTELKESTAKNEQLKNQQLREKFKLKDARKEQNELFQQLKKKEAIYKEQLKLQREQLKLIIGEADPDMGITEEMENDEIGDQFERNRGFHPWPVDAQQAIVISEFGVTEDPFGNRVENDGIEIRAARGAEVKAIYGGRVTAVKRLFLLNSLVVMVQHGKYRSVYSNLDKVHVQKGDFVSAAQTLGIINTDSRTDESVLQFLIYKVPAVFIDPLSWLFPQ